MSRTEIASRLAADLPLVADHPNGATHVRVAPLTDADLGVPNRGDYFLVFPPVATAGFRGSGIDLAER